MFSGSVIPVGVSVISSSLLRKELTFFVKRRVPVIYSLKVVSSSSFLHEEKATASADTSRMVPVYFILSSIAYKYRIKFPKSVLFIQKLLQE